METGSRGDLPFPSALARFADGRSDGWRELEGLVSEAGKRADTLGPARVLRLGALYRAAAADLAIARRRFPGDPMVRHLESLVSRARGLVYGRRARRAPTLAFFRRDYWRLVAERPLPLIVALLLLAAPGVLGAVWAADDPPAAAGLVPAEYRSVAEPRDHDALRELGADERAAFSSEIFTNNIQVSFLAFATGITAGLLTALVLAYNGILLGVVGALAADAGGGAEFLELVAPHGILEMSLIVVTAAAGIRMGWALVDPGRRPRAKALGDEARRAVLIVLGSIPWFVLAGIVEGFVTPEQPGLAPALAIGCGLAALYWALVAWLGRVREPPAAGGRYSRAEAFARR